MRRLRSRLPASTISIRRSGPSGASWGSRPMVAREGQAKRPCSSARSPTMARNSVLLPVPLRPTRPTRAPEGICAVARSIRSRPATRMETSSITSMGMVWPQWRPGCNRFVAPRAGALDPRRGRREAPLSWRWRRLLRLGSIAAAAPPSIKCTVTVICHRNCSCLYCSCITRTNNPAFRRTLFPRRLRSRPRRAARKDRPSPNLH
jgi:hypothetical protein